MGFPLRPGWVLRIGLDIANWTDVYPGLIALSGVITALLALAGARFRSAPGGEWFAATMGLSSVWTVAALTVALSGDPVILVLAEIVMSGCSLVVPVTWIAFVVSYVGYEKWLTRRRIGMLFALPLAGVAAIATSPETDLYFADISIVHRADGISVVSTPPGPLAWIVLLYVFVLILVGLGLVARLVVTQGLFSGQAAWLLVGSLPPFAVVLLEPAGLVGDEHLPLTPIGFTLMGIAYGYGLFRHRLFDLSPGTWRLGAEIAFDGLNEGVVIVDDHGDVLGCNRSACDLFGWDRTAAFGRDVADLEPPLAAARRTQETIEFSRNSRRYEISTSAIADSRDREIGHALVVRDVTERYERRQQLEVLNRALRHNLRNDMLVVGARAEALFDRYDDPMAETIRTTAEDLVQMAEKARTVEERLDRTEARVGRVDVEPFLAAVIEQAQATAGEVPVETAVASDLGVETDRELLEVILVNLVENAIEHGVPGSAEGHDDPPVRVRAERVADGVAFEVCDDGPGIPWTELDVIERGSETPTSHGTGLGLWLVTWGAARLDAEMTFDVADGTTARLVVPDQ